MNRSKSPGISLLVFLLGMFSFSCNKNEVIIDGGSGGRNVPSYASTLNAFSYSINAQRLTDTPVIPLTFNKNRLQNAVAVSNVTSGRAIFSILDQANAIIHTDTFKLPGMYRALMITGLPASVSITFQDFTGSISYALVGDTLISGFTLADFPNTRGWQRTYFVYDSLARQSDTLVVTVFGQITLPGNISATIWQYAYRARTETVYVNVLRDTVRFYRDPNSWWGEFNYVFPLYVGKRWGAGFGGSSAVVEAGTVITPAGSFSNSLLVENRWSFLNDHRLLRTWLVPRVGIVKAHRAGISFGYANITWELLRYGIIS